MLQTAAATMTRPQEIAARLAALSDTPAFVYDEAEVQRLLAMTDLLRADGHCDVLFSTKSLPLSPVMELMAPRLDGFAASSLFEARLARETVGPDPALHLTTPGIRPIDAGQIGELCDFVSFNSLGQWERFRAEMQPASCGIRVNPQLSFLDDDRYDPCRSHSKLGAPLDALVEIAERQPERLEGLEGVHVHTNCDSTDLRQLDATVEHLCSRLDGLLRRLEWINLGGGYLFNGPDDVKAVARIAAGLQTSYGLRVIIEPGAALIRTAGYIVASVLDLFDSGGKRLAVLDTTANHMPEVFEYGDEPVVTDHRDGAPHEYILAGSTCLAGDIFGAYRFEEPLDLGSRVAFAGMGAYTLSKAHTFNGINLPDIYALTPDGALVLKKRFTYKDYSKHWGRNAPL